MKGATLDPSVTKQLTILDNEQNQVQENDWSDDEEMLNNREDAFDKRSSMRRVDSRKSKNRRLDTAQSNKSKWSTRSKKKATKANQQRGRAQ